jgi:hypothetical protein
MPPWHFPVVCHDRSSSTENGSVASFADVRQSRPGEFRLRDRCSTWAVRRLDRGLALCPSERRPVGQLGSRVGCPPAIAGLGETLPCGQGPRVYGAGSVLLYPPNRGPIPLWWTEVWSGSQDAVTRGNGGTGTFGSGHERRPPANRGPPSVTRVGLGRALSATASGPHVDSCEGHQRDDQQKAGQERATRGGGWGAEGRVRGAGRWGRRCSLDRSLRRW